MGAFVDVVSAIMSVVGWGLKALGVPTFLCHIWEFLEVVFMVGALISALSALYNAQMAYGNRFWMLFGSQSTEVQRLTGEVQHHTCHLLWSIFCFCICLAVPQWLGVFCH